MIDQSIIDELVAIERAAVRVSELIDFNLLRDRSKTYEERNALRGEFRLRRAAIAERINDSVLWTVYSSIARAEAEAIEWRAYAKSLDAKRGEQLSFDVDARAASDDALRRQGTSDGGERRREAAGE